MVDSFIGFEVAGIEELRREFGNWPKQIQDEVIDAVNKDLIKRVRKYPPYAYVPFKRAYGGWFSEKQRRYVMAKIRAGEINPGVSNRTNRFGQGWKVIDKGTSSLIVNEVPYGRYLMGTGTQARMHKIIGWDMISEFIQKNMGNVLNAARQGLMNALRKIGS